MLEDGTLRDPRTMINPASALSVGSKPMQSTVKVATLAIFSVVGARALLLHVAHAHRTGIRF